MAEYVDRDALLKSMQKKHHNLLKSHGVWSEYAYGFDSAMAMVSCQPTADVVEVRHGHWKRAINQKHSAKWSSKVACSVCRCAGYERYAYCPNCGAKMDGKGEEDV